MQRSSLISIAMVAATDMVPASRSLQLVQLAFSSHNSTQFSPPVLCFSSHANSHTAPRLCALRTGSDGGRIGSREAYGSELIGRSIVKEIGAASDEYEEGEAKRDQTEGEDEEEGEEVVDWEDKILEETVPLVGFVRMILHSGRYQSGDRLKPEHERTILEKLLPYHPESEKKIGCGIDYIMVGYHPDFKSSRCLFIVRTDGQLVDFSYWKCMKGLIRKKYPMHADSFILRHFRRRRRNIGR